MDKKRMKLPPPKYGLSQKLMINKDGSYSFPNSDHKFKTIEEAVKYIKSAKAIYQFNAKNK